MKLLCDDWLNVPLEDQQFDLIYTDPPYGMNYSSQIRGDKRWNSIGKSKELKTIVGDDKGIDWIKFADKTYASLKNNRYLVYHANMIAFHHSFDSLTYAGYQYYGTIIWNKKSSIGGNLKGTLKRDWEPIHYWAKGRPTFNGNRISEITDWTYTHKRRDYLGHPTQKPLPLCMKIIEIFCPDFGTILDPFSGVGTIHLAALKTGRQCISVEIDPEYVKIAEKRLVSPNI